MDTKRIPILISVLSLTCIVLVYVIGTFRPLGSTDRFANPALVAQIQSPTLVAATSTTAPTVRLTAAVSSPPSSSPTPSLTQISPTITQPASSTPTHTPTFSPTPTRLSSGTPSRTPSRLPTLTATTIASDTPTGAPSTETPSGTPTATATLDPLSVAATQTSVPALATFEAIATRAFSASPALPPAPPRAIDASTNFLLIGTDTRIGDPNWKPNTDVMMVLFMDTTNQRAALLSLPRDLVVAIPGHQAFRLNSAYHYGWEQNGVAGGVAELKESLRNDFGIRIDHWALIDFDGLSKIIDTLGGIDVNVTCPLSDTIDEQSFTIPAGMNHMDYLTAKRYVQSRYSTSDISRNYRQQRVVWAMAKKALALNAPDRIPALYAALKDSIATDMNLFDMVGLVPSIYQLDVQNHPERLHVRVLEAPNVYPWVATNGAWLYLPDYQEISRTLDTLFDSPALAAEQPAQAECPARAATPPPTDAPTSPTPADSLAPTPIVSPDAAALTATPLPVSTDQPTLVPAVEPTQEPTLTPADAPTSEPTSSAVQTPTPAPATPNPTTEPNLPAPTPSPAP